VAAGDGDGPSPRSSPASDGGSADYEDGEGDSDLAGQYDEYGGGGGGSSSNGDQKSNAHNLHGGHNGNSGHSGHSSSQSNSQSSLGRVRVSGASNGLSRDGSLGGNFWGALDWRLNPQEALAARVAAPFGDWRSALSSAALTAAPPLLRSFPAEAAAPCPPGATEPEMAGAVVGAVRAVRSLSTDSESFQPLDLLPHSVLLSLGSSSNRGDESFGPFEEIVGSRPFSSNHTWPMAPLARLQERPLDAGPSSPAAVGAGLSDDLSGAGELTEYLAALVLGDSSNG
jgi:hypothetical protein